MRWDERTGAILRGVPYHTVLWCAWIRVPRVRGPAARCAARSLSIHGLQPVLASIPDQRAISGAAAPTIQPRRRRTRTKYRQRILTYARPPSAMHPSVHLYAHPSIGPSGRTGIYRTRASIGAARWHRRSTIRTHMLGGPDDRCSRRSGVLAAGEREIAGNHDPRCWRAPCPRGIVRLLLRPRL